MVRNLGNQFEPGDIRQTYQLSIIMLIIYKLILKGNYLCNLRNVSYGRFRWKWLRNWINMLIFRVSFAAANKSIDLALPFPYSDPWIAQSVWKKTNNFAFIQKAFLALGNLLDVSTHTERGRRPSSSLVTLKKFGQNLWHEVGIVRVTGLIFWANTKCSL